MCRPFRRQANWEAIASGGSPPSARQFLFAVRFRREKEESIFKLLNRIEKAIAEHGFSARRLGKSEIKRMLALYFGTSAAGEEIPDIEGENYLKMECVSDV